MTRLAEDMLVYVVGDGVRLSAVNWRLSRGIAGAHLLGLFDEGRLALSDGKVAVLSRDSTGDPELDAAIATIADSRRRRRPADWIRRLNKGQADRYAGILEKRGLMIRRWRLLPMPGTRIAPTSDLTEEDRAAPIREALYGADPDAETAAAIGLLRAIGLLSDGFGEWIVRAGEIARADPRLWLFDSVSAAIVADTPHGGGGG